MTLSKVYIRSRRRRFKARKKTSRIAALGIGGVTPSPESDASESQSTGTRQRRHSTRKRVATQRVLEVHDLQLQVNLLPITDD